MKLSSVLTNLIPRPVASDDRGFTLTEVLVVIIIAGVLAGIAAPSWLTFVDRQRMTTVRSELLLKVKEAQAKAIRTKTLQTIVIDNPNPGVTRPTVSVIQSTRNAATGSLVTGTTDPAKKILGGESNSSFILDTIPPTSGTAIKTITFNYSGTVDEPTSPLGPQATLADNQTAFYMYRVRPRANSTSDMSACLIVDTLIGAIREVTDEQCK
jgi:prepilin-type N-terminal cleavage/methylation domain-containing protein